MRFRAGPAVFLGAALIGGAWVLTDRPGPRPAVAVRTTGQSTTTSTLTADQVIGRIIDDVMRRPLCEAPSTTLTPEQQEAVEKTISELMTTMPPPPTVPSDSTVPEAVTNLHRRMVPC
jgi:hypothetical protein